MMTPLLLLLAALSDPGGVSPGTDIALNPARPTRETAIRETAMFRKIDDSISVSPQISPDQVAEAAAQGFTMIINNRPDDEQPGQPSGGEIEAAAKAAGLQYRAIPIGHSGFSEPQVKAMAAALADANGPALAFCRSGTRSTFAWALARGAAGDTAEGIAAKAAAAGYDIAPIRAFLPN
ncbi:hypothetical protein G432_10570 [Sphingomonas sp. MM-1]|nr:hypothetical protein G432_10570 [Sphingomonas sp. MM-1]